MLFYNLRLAWKSVLRHPALSGLIVAGIALGVAVSTSFVTIWHVLAADPIPGKSDRLHYVRVNSWGGEEPWDEEGHPPTLMTWQDMRRLLGASDIPVRQTASFHGLAYVRPQEGEQKRPFQEGVRMTTADFFPMFEAPFRYGSGWDRAADAKPEAVAVIGSDLNERLFGGRNSVGSTLRINDRDFKIAGVLAPWRPKVRHYDMNGNPYEEPEQVFLPITLFPALSVEPAGTRSSWRVETGEFVANLDSSEMTWIQMWVELDGPADEKAYHSFLDAYAAEQKKLGRFPQAINNRLSTVVELMEEWEVVPQQAKALAAISALFLVIAALNLIGLFLGKFLARSSVVGVRRALGASRGAIFAQHLVECEMVALIGGLLGLGLSLGVLALVNQIYRPAGIDEAFFQLDPPMMLAALGFALLAGAIAGVYPSWRICAIAPARHLKNQ
jgi:putative ABC transport system permease protein